MATFHTELNNKETKGEKKFYFRLKNKLSDEYHVWHNFHLHQTGAEIDFLILHPVDGLFLIEVKDWSVDQIIQINDRDVLLQTGNRHERRNNPIAQVKGYSFAVRNSLKEIKCLIHQDGGFEGRLVFPVNYGVVLSNNKYNNSGYSAKSPDFDIEEEGDNRTCDLTDNMVKVMNIYQSKGIDARYVAIMEFDRLQTEQGDHHKSAELGYVALTRAKELCFVYYLNRNNPVNILESIITETGKL